MAAVFVAGKVEECIRRARDIVNVFHHLYSLIRGLPAHPIDYVGDTYYVWRDRLCTAEALLLRTLGFHVQPASPVTLLISYLKVLELSSNRALAQLAFSFLNDSLRTNAPILYQPNVLAVTAIDLAAERQGFRFPNDCIAEWFWLFDVNAEELRECRKIVLALYFVGEIDVLLPLTREELKVFSGAIDDGVQESEKERGREIERSFDKSAERSNERSTERISDRYTERDRYRSNERTYTRYNDRYNERDRYHRDRSRSPYRK